MSFSPGSLPDRGAPSLGPILPDTTGRTVYLYTNDAPGISTCYDQCAVAWPPVMAQDQAALPTDIPGVLGTTPRTDGGTQLTHNGMPLYYWAKDQKPGDTTGQGVGNVWFVVHPSPAPSVQVRSDPDLGDILVDARGMTLYLFTQDEPWMSTCYGQCLHHA